MALSRILGGEEIAHEAHHAAPAVPLVGLDTYGLADVDPLRARSAHDVDRTLELVCATS